MSFEAPDDFAAWMKRIQQREARAVEVVWREYFEKLIARARIKLGSAPRRDQDEEDIALSALQSFVRGAERGRFPQLQDRDDLWRLLLTITARKVVRRQRRQFAAKRGGGAVRGESVFMRADCEGSDGGIADVLGDEPSPEIAAELAESYRLLIERLNDKALEQIIALKLENWTNAEIADRLQCATRTVERKLELIREKWQTAPLK
jgi:DNA-directed RNA polymerase specialized sigma24 family protein